MRQFDDILRRGLMEANLAQYETVLDRLPEWEPDFSPRYRRERMRLLADPWSWVKRRERPVWKRAARNVACVLLACTVAFGALMAASPTVRAAVVGWFKETFMGYTYYTGPAPDGKPEGEQAPTFRPTWLPEGYVLDQAYTNGTADLPEDPLTANWIYQNGDDTLQFSCFLRPSGNLGALYGAAVDEASVLHKTKVQGYDADFYQEDVWNSLIWKNEKGMLFWLHSKQDQTTLERVGEGVTEIKTAPLPEYELTVPTGARKSHHYVLPEYVETFWSLEQLGTLTWTYSTLSLHFGNAGTAEQVNVNGIEAQFWQGEEKPITRTVYGKDGTPTTVSRDACYNALLWTDPETNISFLLRGHLDRETLLDMAGHITLKSAETPAKTGK